jgi:ribulose-phosphate 3-epimerase
VSYAARYLPDVDRLLLMGTVIGEKGLDQDPGTPGRVGALVSARRGAPAPEVVVDGGNRLHTVPALAQAGADGVVPGSLVFGDPDPRRAVAEIHALRPGGDAAGRSAFWTARATS